MEDKLRKVIQELEQKNKVLNSKLKEMFILGHNKASEEYGYYNEQDNRELAIESWVDYLESLK